MRLKLIIELLECWRKLLRQLKLAANQLLGRYVLELEGFLLITLLARIVLLFVLRAWRFFFVVFPFTAEVQLFSVDYEFLLHLLKKVLEWLV